MDLKNLIYKENMFPIPMKGDLLIAEPLLDEVFFKRGVVLVLERDMAQGYIGLVMNKKTNMTMQDLLPDWEEGKRVPLYCGGPVESDRLFVIHSLPEIFPNSMEIMPGLYVGADIDTLCEYVDNGGEIDGKVRFFVGYSGWVKDQLVDELSRNVWALRRTVDSDQLLQDHDEEYWKREVEALGSAYRSWLIIPTAPWMN